MEGKNGISSTTPGKKKESKSFKKLVHNFMGYTSAHGIGRLADAKNLFWKIFWSLVCMGALSMFLYQFIGLFKQFVSKPVTTSVSITFEKRLPFPAVTICNLNMVRREAMPPELEKFLKSRVGYSKSSNETENTGENRRRRSSGDSGGPQTNYSSTTVVPTPGDPQTNYDSTAVVPLTGDSQTNYDSTAVVPTPGDPQTNYDSTAVVPTPGDSQTNYDSTAVVPPAETGNDDDDATNPQTKESDHDDDLYNNNDEYSQYREDVNDHNSDYYEENEDDEFPDEKELSPDVRLRYEIDNLIGTLEEDELYWNGHLFEVLIKNCTWKGVDCKTGNLSKYWSQHWNYKYGNCYTFNPGINFHGENIGVLKTTKPGPSQGLQLEIDVQQDQYIGPLSAEAGVRVLLHDQGAMPFPFEEGFSVSTGMATSVGISKTKIARLDRFNNKSCLSANELPMTNIYRRHKNITTYSQQACLNSCLGLSQRIRCKCSENSFPSDKPPCDVFNPETSKCLKVVKYLFNNDKLSCLGDCSQPCEEEVIQKTISSSQWPSKAYKEYRTHQNKDYNPSINMLQLNVFFNELNYEKIEEQFSYGTINLLADVGGQLGLWIGISVITVCELIELIVMFFTVCVKKINAASEVHEIPAYG
ncbi:degenerin deg-1-like isoform X2 [Dendronephthya gigantea]|nr:degenerin deg-1-like isoform X2 [Dendronephthya gigantea]XP_028411246.1 degenerin deg-1-like isoform X2 [Dendronephthya gigantea]XP_028411247.1 degenerin deg-1-like isoform X2 [Dendronephthya gigantea]XP_028411248.1 degenerin deg-1-like isoform X2 [Dendronephthya gigantea]XP_028411249.1 degenerin deg-1-like isoform X2 [Dendronephthya gigantea]XP_028411250.1 degenerin deg-1-like isoform X2 [Dendronephthya gigantea]